jgi:hypothetical protein
MTPLPTPETSSPSLFIGLLLNFAGSVAALIVLYGLYIWCSFRSSRDKASAELWWLPAWKCFRLVIRNIPAGYEITDIRSRAWLRDVVPSGPGSSVNSFRDADLVRSDRIMLSREDDYPLVCFRLEKMSDGFTLVLTDKFGTEIESHELSKEFREFLVEYSAKVQTWGLLKYEINRTYVLPTEEAEGELFDALWAVQEEGKEDYFPLLFLRTEVIRVSI